MTTAAEVEEVLAEHRQEHLPATGGARCYCGEWEGPYTRMTGERSYPAHLVAALLAAGVLQMDAP